MSMAQVTIAVSQIETQRRGYLQLSLTNFDNLLEPAIAAGGQLEVGDALFFASANEPITGWAGIAVSTPAYIKLVPAGGSPDSLTAVFTDVAPVWSHTKQGYYGTGAAAIHRYIGGLYKDAGGDYTFKWLYGTGPGNVPLRYYGNPMSSMVQVQDEKAAGGDGGTFTSGAWRTRTLNTVKTNEIPGASLAANQLTLPAGTYSAEFSAPGYKVEAHQARLRDITNAATLALGSMMWTLAASQVTTNSLGSGLFVLDAPATIELQHRCGSTYADYGFGFCDNNFGENVVYARLVVKKIQ